MFIARSEDACASGWRCPLDCGGTGLRRDWTAEGLDCGGTERYPYFHDHIKLVNVPSASGIDRCYLPSGITSRAAMVG